jgi:hypothetical protein
MTASDKTKDVGVDAVLKNARIEMIPGHDDKYWARGLIHGDAKGRFADGEPIHTSYIVSGPDENGIIRTRNSVYRVELLPTGDA